VTFVGAPAIVFTLSADVKDRPELPVMVAVTGLVSPAWSLGCHAVVTTPVALVRPELGVKVVAGPVDGYPLAALKETGTPTWDGAVRVAVTDSAVFPAVYGATKPVIAMVGATSPVCAGETSVPLPAIDVSDH